MSGEGVNSRAGLAAAVRKSPMPSEGGGGRVG